MDFESILGQFSDAQGLRIVIQVGNRRILINFESSFWRSAARNRYTGSKSVHFEAERQPGSRHNPANISSQSL